MDDPDPNLERLRHAPVRGERRYAVLYPGYQECFECRGDGCCLVCGGEGVSGGARCGYCNGHGRCNTCGGAGQIPQTEMPDPS